MRYILAVRNNGSRGGPCLAVLAVLLAWTTVAPAERPTPPRNAVEELRQALRNDRDPVLNPDAVKSRKAALEKRTAALHTIGELSQALQLQEWYDESLAAEIRNVDEDIRLRLAERLAKAVRDTIKRGDATARWATANFIGEVATGAQAVGIKSPFVRERIAELAPDLVELTKDPDVLVREAAARALGKIGPDPKTAVPALARILKEDEAVPRRAAAEALGGMMRELSRSEKKYGIQTRRESLREEVITAGLAVLPVAGRAFGRTRTDPDPEVRRLSVEAIQQTAVALRELIEPAARELTVERPLPGEKAVPRPAPVAPRDLEPLLKGLWKQTPALTAATRDPVAVVRLAASRTLEEMADVKQKSQKVHEGMPPPAPEPREGDKGIRPAGGILKEDEAQPRREDDPFQDEVKQAVDALAAQLNDPDTRVRLAALDALEALGEAATPAAPALLRALGDQDLFVRWAAARTLHKVEIKKVAARATPALLPLLKDPDLDVRLAATKTLAAYGPAAKQAAPALAEALKAGDVEFRVEVLHTLDSIGAAARPDIPAIAAVLADPDPRLRQAAAEVLGRIGPAARDAEPALRRVLNDPVPDVRRAASLALLSILTVPEK